MGGVPRPLTRACRFLSRVEAVSSRFLLSDGGLHGVDRMPTPPPPAFRTWGLFARSLFLFEALNPLPPPPLRSAPREHPHDLPVWRPGEAPTLCLVDFGVRGGSDRGAATRPGAALRGHFWP